MMSLNNLRSINILTAEPTQEILEAMFAWYFDFLIENVRRVYFAVM